MDLDKLTALQLAEKIKQHQISVLDGVKHVFDPIEKKDPKIHAYLDTYKKEAFARAKQVQKGIEDGTYTGPLTGVPIAIKDNICMKGKTTTCASKILENFVPQYNAEVIDRLERAGLVIIGKTNMDEFAMGSTTETSAYGITRNPWDTERVPGGSSGGSCAAVAAGETYLALGSDTGGSIRQPSSFCGVTGIKPTYGTVSRYGLVAYASSLDQIGPVGKDVSDCAALLEIIAGHDPKDSTSIERQDLNFTKDMEGKLMGMKFGVPKEYLAEGLDPEVKAAFMDVLKILTGQGAIVEFFSMKTTEYMIPAYYIIASAEASSNLERFDGVKYGYRAKDYEGLHDMYKKTRTEGFGEEVKRRIMLGSFVLSSGYYDAYYLKALKTKALIKKEFDSAFEKYDVLLAPAAPYTAPKIGESLKDPLAMYLGDIYTVAVNLCGLPGITVPCGMDSAGLPVGIQMIGDCFMEKKILRAAKEYETCRGAFPTAEEGGRKA
ncbi:MAG: Asp-tRNA(Asn)/Glu-tRNA(Gln) amidotransferase subunit GatA [Blautia sp.]|nr:Asp-tRNA(Asn)/Glu-tRNA(Gln) amidotransferase subunit GatA [Blautia sp.]MDY3998798.1 Asp-tRNA(Asn)/Glu-tRNA(Gln) amidotransferase subunit GatA [Blautia sp.]